MLTFLFHREKIVNLQRLRVIDVFHRAYGKNLAPKFKALLRRWMHMASHLIPTMDMPYLTDQAIREHLVLQKILIPTKDTALKQKICLISELQISI